MERLKSELFDNGMIMKSAKIGTFGFQTLTVNTQFYYTRCNSYCPQMDWIELNFYQTLTSRQVLFNTIKANNYQVGNNLLASRLSVLNLKILSLIDQNLSLASFKVKYKEKLLSNAPLNCENVTKKFFYVITIAAFRLFLLLFYQILYMIIVGLSAK